jgi:hypothetical protein
MRQVRYADQLDTAIGSHFGKFGLGFAEVSYGVMGGNSDPVLTRFTSVTGHPRPA